MASSEIRGNDTERAMEAEIARYTDAAAVELAAAQAAEAESTTRRYPSRSSSAADRERLVNEARNIAFPIGLRGYERVAVDQYVEQVNRLLTELEMYSSPESAVRHALDEVSEETRGLLERARQTSEEITARSRVKADDRLQQAEREARDVHAAAQREAEQIRELAQRDAQELREGAQREAAKLRETTTREVTELRESALRETKELRADAHREAEEVRAAARGDADTMLGSAETRARELSQNAETVWRERRRLIDDIRAVGEQLVALGETEARRFTRLGDSAPFASEGVSSPAPGRAGDGEQPV